MPVRRSLQYAVVALLAAAAGLLLPAVAQAIEPTKVVLVGIAGLRWSDVSSTNTPTLYRLAGRASIGTLSVRAAGEVTCPKDGWLTLSAGDRATAREGRCDPRYPTYAGRPEDWQQLTETQQDTVYGTQLGRLGDTLKARGACATAVGDGARLALVDGRGALGRHADEVTPAVLAACPLTIVDLGEVPLDSRRAEAVAAADKELAKIVEPAEAAKAAILVTGLSDEPDATTTHLRLGLAAGPGFEPGWLGSSSTRQDGLAQLTDLTPTLTELIGAGGDKHVVGSRWRTTGERPADLDAAIAQLNGFDTAERVVRQQSMWLFAGLVVIQLAGYGLAFLSRRRLPAVLAALVAGAVPVSAFLADLVPWPTAQHPAVLLWSALLTSIALLATAAALTLKQASWIAPSVLAGVTTLVLAVDVITGSKHQTGNLMTPGDLPVVGGRFFGFGNVAFSIFVTSALLLAAGVAAELRRRGRRAWPAALGIGAAAVLIDGWPGWGADFGGILAAVPAVVVLTAGIAGIELTVRRLILTAVAAVCAVSALAVADWLRPPSKRSHLGGFVQQVIDGDAMPVVVRKAEMTIGTVTNGGPLAGLAIAVLLLAAYLVLRPPNPLRAAYDGWPTLQPALHAILVLGLVGFAVNDSGLIVPVTVLATALPLVVLAVRVTAARSSPPPQSAPAG